MLFTDWKPKKEQNFAWRADPVVYLALNWTYFTFLFSAHAVKWFPVNLWRHRLRYQQLLEIIFKQSSASVSSGDEFQTNNRDGPRMWGSRWQWTGIRLRRSTEFSPWGCQPHTDLSLSDIETEVISSRKGADTKVSKSICLIMLKFFVPFNHFGPKGYRNRSQDHRSQEVHRLPWNGME